MKIHAFVWPDDRIEHIARHGVKPQEVEEACFGRALVQRAKSYGENPVYYVLGQTTAGRYLFCVIIRFPDGNAYPVTARPMPSMGQPMSNQKLPTTDSIAELAEFWDTHDLTDFESELEEVDERVFEREATIPLCLPSETAEAVQRLAQAQGLPASNLIETWVLEKVASLPPGPNVER